LSDVDLAWDIALDGDDLIVAGEDIRKGGAGNDRLLGGRGRDRLDGGDDAGTLDGTSDQKLRRFIRHFSEVKYFN